MEWEVLEILDAGSDEPGRCWLSMLVAVSVGEVLTTLPLRVHLNSGALDEFLSKFTR